jgi:DNA-binding transcriptional ArsR family regulator
MARVEKVSADTDLLDRAFRALADPGRRAMLHQLAGESCSVRRLAEPLPITLAAAVQHVQVLQDSGLITTRKVGRERTCTLRAPGLLLVEDWLQDRRSTWERRLERLGQVLDRRAGDEPSPEFGPGAQGFGR